MKQVQEARGTTAQSDSYTGLSAQISVDTERNELRLHDGETPGGHRILNLTQLYELFMRLDSEFGDVAFDAAGKGILVRVGDRQWVLRGLDAAEDGGIIITDGLGTNQNPTFAIDEEWLSDFLTTLVAGKINFVTTTGTGAAYVATLPTSWKDEEGDGSLFAVKFHTDSTAEDTTLRVDEGVNPGDALPLVLTDGNEDVRSAVKANSYSLVIRADNKYVCLDLQTVPAEVEIPEQVLPERYDGYFVFGAARGIPFTWVAEGVDTSELDAEGKAFLLIRGSSTGPGLPTSTAAIIYVTNIGGNIWHGYVPQGRFDYSNADGAFIVTGITMPGYNPAAMYGPPLELIPGPPSVASFPGSPLMGPFTRTDVKGP